MRYELRIYFISDWVKEELSSKWIKPTAPLKMQYKSKAEALKVLKGLKDKTVEKIELFDSVTNKIEIL